MKILIVEDDMPVALVLKAILRGVADKIYHASTLMEGVELLRSNTINLVLLDLSLPDSPSMKTLEIIRDMKNLGKWVVVMTGNAAPNISGLVLDAGADACFFKGDISFINWLKDILIKSPGPDEREPATLI